MDIRYLRLTPSNPSASYQASAGTSLIRFTVPDGPYFLSGPQLRLSGRLRVQATAGGALPGAPNDVRISSSSGAHGCFQQLTVSSQRMGQVLERVQHYPRLASIMLSQTHSRDDYIGQSSQSIASVNDVAARLNARAECDFSMPLFSGVLAHPNLPLDRVWGFGGLIIELQLSTARQFLAGANAGDYDFLLTNLEISCPVVSPGPEMIKPLLKAGVGQMNIMAFQSLYAVLNTTDESRQVQLGSNNVAATMASYIVAANANSVTDDTTAPHELPYTSLTYSRGGQRAPQQFVTTRTLASVEDAEVSWQKSSAFYDYGEGHLLQDDTKTVLANRLGGASYKQTPFGWRIQSSIGAPYVETRFVLAAQQIDVGPKGIAIIS